MSKALFYKEWVKTRQVLFLIVAVYCCFFIYVFINTQQTFRLQTAVQTWVNMLLKSSPVFPSAMSYLPVLTGLLLGLAQFVPELVNKRFKLTLHLPMLESKIVFISLLYGLLILLLIYVFSAFVLTLEMQIFYPAEILMQIYPLFALWYLSASLAYLFVAWICIEPVWRFRLFDALIAIAVLSLFFISNRAIDYIYFLPHLLVLLFLCVSFSFYSTIRFKEGAQ